MRRRTYFTTHPDQGWPDLKSLQRYFLTSAGRKEAFGEQESWGLQVEGVDGTAQLQHLSGRVDVNLTIQGDLNQGILLFYNKKGAGQWQGKYSKGDLSRLNDRIDTVHGDSLPIGLFVSFELAWKAVAEFIERDGALPLSIAWVDDKDLPAGMSFVRS